MRECLGKHAYMRSTFPIAILNPTFFFFAKRDDPLGRRAVCQKLTIINPLGLLNGKLFFAPVQLQVHILDS